MTQTATETPFAGPLEEMRERLYTNLRPLTLKATNIVATEQRSATGEAQLVLEGHAAVFDSPTIIDYGVIAFEEVIARGAFRKILSSGIDVICQANHCGEPLGRISNDTLEINEDARGVAYRCLLADTDHALNTWKLVKRGDYPGCSFTFCIAEGGDRWDMNAPRPDSVIDTCEWYGRRTILELGGLTDIGPVTWPAYDGTDVAASIDAQSAPADGSQQTPSIAEPASRASVQSVDLMLRVRAARAASGAI